ncbi:MAG: nitrile hydratase subunit alpha, partial [Nitrososphaerales archaeon]
MPHTEDVEAHIESIHEDTEYWGGKRLQSRIFRLIRKREISFYEIIQASPEALRRRSVIEPMNANQSVEEKIASLEQKLGDLIKGVTIAGSFISDMMHIEEGREESGSYDPSFKFAHMDIEGTVDERLVQLSLLLAEYETLLEALFQVLVKKGIIRESRLQEMLSAKTPPSYENGARIVAKAWLDSEFKSRLLSDAKRTLREMDFALNRTPKLVVVENTDNAHNVIVCTLCSCYPYELLGNAPWWYKGDAYRQQIIQSPRKLLEEMFEFKVAKDVELRVYDSTSDIRYMVLPMRPKDSDGLGEEELSKLVTENSLIGIGHALSPSVVQGNIEQRA